MKSAGIVIGGGAFGTALASILAKSVDQVVIKVRSDDVYEAINSGENGVYLPGLTLPENISAAKDWDELDKKLEGHEKKLIISGLPAAAIGEYFKENKDYFVKMFKQGIPLVSLSKGIDPVTLELSDDLFYDLFNDYKDQIMFLSGPSFAKEIIQEQITLVTLAGRHKGHLEDVSKLLECSYFKALPSYDVKGVLLGGALKNVLAIAGGIVEGLGFNHNTRAAMITRGIAEMLRFGKVFNARPETFYGLSGMGDLILTTTGELSRNKTFGIEIAKGRKAKEIIASQRSVVEGYKTTMAVHLLSQKYDVRARIFSGVYQVLYEDMEPRMVIEGLMQSPSRFEID
ncbi:MAG: glycerol-3-phosphate dehydrogenase [Halobacteriovorax sp.]|nr:glycerol-3-phosphate dehydrogenase [Halobacteriovorax sp.]